MSPPAANLPEEPADTAPNFAARFTKVSFLHNTLNETDPEVATALQGELKRQQDGIELIASENIVSPAVLEAQGSVATNKYAEGYPGKRYYGGCEEVDKIEKLAIERACKLFGAKFANVQPHSGAQANEEVCMALMKPGDTLLGMSLDAGGHLSHGAGPNLSSKVYKSVQYGVKADGYLDYDQVRKLAIEQAPKVIIAGGSAYSRQIDFKKFREIVNEVNAKYPGLHCKLVVDMAHYAGLVAGNQYDNPMQYADVVTSTTHKTLRGPRGGLILTNDEELSKKINSAVFPGTQGGPLMHIIAAKAVCFKEALEPEFLQYAKNIKENAKVLGDELMGKGIKLTTDGTDSHMVLLDLRPKGIKGKDLENAMVLAGLTANKNSVPGDEKPMNPSGIRLGSPAATARGFGPEEFKQIGAWVAELVDGLSAKKGPDEMKAIEDRIHTDVKAMCSRFPIYANISYVGRSGADVGKAEWASKA